MTATLQPRSIDAYLPAAAAAERLMDVALPLVGRFQAHLTGLHVIPHIPIYVDAGMGVGADFYNAQDKMLAEEADRTARSAASVSSPQTAEVRHARGGDRAPVTSRKQ